MTPCSAGVPRQGRERELGHARRDQMKRRRRELGEDPGRWPEEVRPEVGGSLPACSIIHLHQGIDHVGHLSRIERQDRTGLKPFYSAPGRLWFSADPILPTLSSAFIELRELRHSDQSNGPLARDTKSIDRDKRDHVSKQVRELGSTFLQVVASWWISGNWTVSADSSHPPSHPGLALVAFFQSVGRRCLIARRSPTVESMAAIPEPIIAPTVTSPG
jgi:hypothetical protein